MKLTGYEMETIILYNQAEPNAQVYTHDAKLIAKLRRLHDAAPEKVYADFDEPNGTLHRPQELCDRPTAVQRCQTQSRQRTRPESRSDPAPTENEIGKASPHGRTVCAEILLSGKESLWQKKHPSKNRSKR